MRTTELKRTRFVPPVYPRQALEDELEGTVRVRITVNDPTAFDRGSDPEWTSAFYGPMDQQQMLHWLTWNCLVNGYTDARRIDGMADLEEGVVTMEITQVMTDITEVWTR